jgi:Uma2 family endonuclease
MADFPEYIEKVKKTLVLVKNIVSLKEITGVSRMSTDSKTYLTPEEYLHRERTAEYRSEYYRGETFAMAGASANHNLIVSNCIQTLGQQLKKKPCRVYPSDLKVRIKATGLYAYPDLSIVCGEPELESKDGEVLLNPMVIECVPNKR